MAFHPTSATVDSITDDTGTAGDFITTDQTLIVAGTVTGTGGGAEQLGVWANDGSTQIYLGTATLTAVNGLNSWSLSTPSQTIPLGNYTIEVFNTASNVYPGGSALATHSLQIICFMPGTMIRTPDGEVAVETLKAGDLVLTADRRAVPVSWLGRQTVCTVFADPIRVQPIRIKAGAIAENVPSRDLLVSPDHAILVDGALIQAGALVNGTSIVRETRVPRTFTYYHVEVDDHSLILAENTPAETFVDNIDRMNFDNWAEHQALYPEGKSISELPYPRAESHRQVPVAIRIKLGERAQAIGAALNAVA